MTAAVFSPAVIAELRHRVIVHNATLDGDAGQLKLGKLKGLYKRFANGGHEHALRKIDDHLQKLRGKLAKATRPFNEGRHPRGRGGQFRSTGNGGERNRRQLLEAAQTQVIPETRYSLYAPPILGAAGVAAGGIAGASAQFPWQGSTATDRAAISALRYGLGRAARTISHGVATTTIKGSRLAANAGINQLNSRYGTSISRFAADAGDRFIPIANAAAERAGRAVGERTGQALQLYTTGVPALARWGAERSAVRIHGKSPRLGRLAGRGAGALVGLAVPGFTIYGKQLYNLTSAIGPYIDAWHPRRVRKSAPRDFLDLWNATPWQTDDPEVLQKQADLLALPPLAKANVTRLARMILQAGGRIFAHQHPSVASHTVGAQATGIGPDVARRIFAQRAARQATGQPNTSGFTVNRGVQGRIRVVAAHTIPAAAGLAGVGAIGGAGAGYAMQLWDERKHPRDQRGRFARKNAAHKGALLGAKIGAAVGTGLGLAAGILAARHGQGERIVQAMARMTAAHPEMTQEAVGGAKEVHARAYYDNHKRGSLRDLELPDELPPGGSAHEIVRNHIENQAAREWLTGEGAAINAARAGGHPQDWYRFQVDEEFDKAVKSQFGKLREEVPVHGPQENARVSSNRLANAFNTVDTSRLSGNQKRIWDHLTDLRQKTLDHIDAHYAPRREAATQATQYAREQSAELTKLQEDLAELPRQFRRMTQQREGEALTPLGQIRSFARQHFGIEIPTGVRREDAIDQIHTRIGAWSTEMTERINRLSPESARAQDEMQAAVQHAEDQLPDRQLAAIPNPFRTTRGRDRFLKPVPDFNERQNEVKAAASKAFVNEAEKHATEARTTLGHLVAAHEIALERRLPGADPVNDGSLAYRFSQAAKWIRQGRQDAAEISSAHRAKLGPSLQAAYDWANAQKNPRQAWQTAKNLSAWASSHGGNATAFALRNWKHIATIAGIGSALGAVDLTAGPGQRFKGRKDWRSARDMDLRVEREWPDPVNRPNEALFGITYRDPKDRNRRRFLTGIHITSAAGDHTTIPTDADADQVIQRVRQGGRGGGGGGGGDQRRPPLNVQDKQALNNALDRLNRNAQIQTVQVPDSRGFRERTGGDAQGQDRVVSSYLYDQHVRFLAQQSHLDGQSTNRPERYWDSLRDIFTARESEVLDRSQRVALLIGGGPFNYRRGIFATPNPQGFPQSTNLNDQGKEGVVRALIRQANLIRPQAGSDQKNLLRRAQFIVAEHYGLNQNQRNQIWQHLDNLGGQQGGQQQQGQRQRQSGEEQSRPEPRAGSGERAHDLFRDTVFPTDLDDDRLRGIFEGQYQSHVRRLRAQHPQASEAELHRMAGEYMENWYRTHKEGEPPRGKQAPIGDLSKYLSWQGEFPDKPEGAPKLHTPRIGGSARVPSAPGIPVPPAGPKPPVPGSHGKGTLGGDVKAAVRPAHLLSQIGGYGLGQIAGEAAHHLAPRGAKILSGGVAGLGAGMYGMYGGRRLGQALGDTSHEREQAVPEAFARMGAGTLGQIAGSHYAGKAVGTAVGRSAVGGAINRAVAAPLKGIGARIGGRVGTWLGAVGGEALEPLGGGVAGSLAGNALGTGIGYLADEGVGLLYRHLSRYGSHVPEMAAKHLKVPAHLRQKHRTAAMVGTTT
jgi:hypothetical protein